MHPVIRLVSFVVLSLALAVGDGPQLLLAALLLSLPLNKSRGAWPAIAGMVRRMRWLWLSIAVVYFWFTPGTPLISPGNGWMPTVEGVHAGILRIAALVLIVMAAGLLLHLTSRQQLFAALHWLAAPLAWAGITRARVAVRMALTLEAVAEVQSLVRAAAVRDASPATPRARWGQTAAELFRAVLIRAETAHCNDMVLPPSDAPPLWQWSVPALLTAAMVGVGMVV